MTHLTFVIGRGARQHLTTRKFEGQPKIISIDHEPETYYDELLRVMMMY